MNFYDEDVNDEKKELTTTLNTGKNKTEVFNKKEKTHESINFHKIYILILAFMILNDYKYDFNSKIINVAFYCRSIRNGGVERVMALLINLLSEEKIFNLYLITDDGKFEDEYHISKNIKRIDLPEIKMNIFKIIQREHIDIFIYNYYYKPDIKKLHKLKKTKVIVYNHSSYFFWIVTQNIYKFEESIYETYKDCKYVISLIPIENDYLFKKWGINSVLMDNPLTFEYDSVIPSDLSQNNIIMIGRGDDHQKRYDIGIKSMKYIIKEIPECKMYILSTINEKLRYLIGSLNLEQNIQFTGYQKSIEMYLKNASLHIFPSIGESYGMVLSETKIFGIPTILCGLDYLALAEGGTVIIYDDNPVTLAKEAIKILKNDTYRKRLGNEARKSMEKRTNKLLAKRWVKFHLAVIKDDKESFKELSEHQLSKEKIKNIMENQLKLIHMRIPELKNLTMEQLESYSF